MNVPVINRKISLLHEGMGGTTEANLSVNSVPHKETHNYAANYLEISVTVKNMVIAMGKDITSIHALCLHLAAECGRG